jgi:L,D-transpeptidase YcbB
MDERGSIEVALSTSSGPVESMYMNGIHIAAARAACVAWMLLVSAACNRSDRSEQHAAGEIDRSWAPQNLTTVKGIPANTVRDAIQQRLGAARPKQLAEDSWRHARALYQQYGRGPLWLTEKGLDEPRVKALANALASADSDAMDLRAYPLAELTQALNAVKSERPTAEQLANADVLLTASYAALGEDLLTGQVNPRQLSQDWHIDPSEEHVDSTLVRSMRETQLEQAITRMRPQDDDYALLRRELLRYRGLVSRGGWNKVPAGKALKPGDKDSPARLAALQSRLRAEGLLGDAGAQSATAAQNGVATADTGAVYDAALAGAVATYQARHGIDVDSVLGPGTVASMNLPAEYRLGQIAGNLERYRWLPRSLGSRYVLVNVPAFRLEAYDGGKKALEMKVIVGAEYNNRATPVFSDSMQYVVFRPYWIPTDSIVANEIEPKAAQYPGYLERENMEYATIDGKRRVRQKPGPKNSLGLVKFMFPNEFAIYLHDTPEGELFEKDVRAFSHGCIRLEHPDQLAELLLGWPADKVHQAMQQGANNQQVNLPSKVPVYILYFTTYASNGELRFGNDLYKRDDALVKAMAPAATAAAEASQAAQALRRAAGA